MGNPNFVIAGEMRRSFCILRATLLCPSHSGLMAPTGTSVVRRQVREIRHCLLNLLCLSLYPFHEHLPLTLAYQYQGH